MHPGLSLLLSLLLPLFATGQDQVRTLAGLPGTPGTADGPSEQARFNDPAGIAVGPDGRAYIADSRNHVIRVITTEGIVLTLAGSAGEPGFTDGPGNAARFNHPTGILVAPTGHILVADTGNHTLRQITADGVVTTLSGAAGIADHLDGKAGDARFRSPIGLALAPDGHLFIADCGNHVIRRLDPAGQLTTFAGTPEFWGARDGVGTNATFYSPLDLAFDSRTNLFVSDANNHALRKISPAGEVTLFAGSPGRDGSTDGHHARFGKPAELVVDARDHLYVADALNHTLRHIRPDGFVSTVSGVVHQAGANDGANGAARFFNPYGLALGTDGRLLVTDAYNQTIREILAPYSVAFLNVGSRLVLTWGTIVGRRYRIEYSPSLIAPDWHPLGPEHLANGTTLSVTNPAPSGATSFLRVLRLP